MKEDSLSKITLIGCGIFISTLLGIIWLMLPTNSLPAGLLGILIGFTTIWFSALIAFVLTLTLTIFLRDTYL